MALIDRIRDVVRARLGGTSPEHEMDEEMRFHVEMAARRNIQRGLPPDEARRRALAAFGGMAQHQETARDGIAPSLSLRRGRGGPHPEPVTARPARAQPPSRP